MTVKPQHKGTAQCAIMTLCSGYSHVQNNFQKHIAQISSIMATPTSKTNTYTQYQKHKRMPQNAIKDVKVA